MPPCSCVDRCVATPILSAQEALSSFTRRLPDVVHLRIEVKGLRWDTTVDLSRTFLAQANLRGANLTKARLNEANLTEAWLDGADQTKASLNEENLTGAPLEFRADSLLGMKHGPGLIGGDHLARLGVTLHAFTAKGSTVPSGAH